jgi:DNA-binding Lrp family transcriptional regulator
MYPGGVWVPWGVDPRVTPGEIGRTVGLGRQAVWARIRAWLQDGFFRPYEIRPNYRLFGVELQQVDVHLADPLDARDLLDELELVEGVTSAWVGFGDTRSAESVWRCSVCYVDDHVFSVERRMRMFRRLSTRRVADGPFAYALPDVTHTPSALDWRMIDVLRANPTASLTRVARQLRVTLKTLIRRRDALLADNAIWYLPRFDWSQHPSVALRVFHDETREPAAVLRDVENRYPDLLPMSLADMGFYRHELESAHFFGARVPASSPDRVQGIMIEVAQIPGVTRVRSDLQGPWRYYSPWVDRALARRFEGLATPSPALP